MFAESNQTIEASDRDKEHDNKSLFNDIIAMFTDLSRYSDHKHIIESAI
jgi:hypothetical protein